ncbi:MAG: alpha-amylase family glycosyl hydrolase [Bryobacteraceae bacterium]|jgi:1,4-alpha-glucan branching enzyme
MYNLVAAPSSTTSLGANLSADLASVSFRVWAPNASAVTVLLQPDGSSPQSSFALQPDAANNAYWSADISGAAAGHLYQFSVQNKGGDVFDPGGLPLLRTDPCARQVTSSDPKLPALIVNPSTYTFQAPFSTPQFQNFILYQAHVGSFAGKSDGLPVSTDTNGSTATFADVGTKLDYIRSLNFNAVQFLPNGEYRGSEGEAYNPSNYYAPELLYGAPDDLRALVDACHQRGLAVFFDVVYNHMDTVDNTWQFDGNNDHRTDVSDATTGGGIYFSTVETGFGRRPDHDSPDVQRFFIENAAMWFDEYHADGLRFDSAVNFSAGGLQAIVQTLVARYPDKFIYAEDNAPDYIFGQIGFRGMWDMNSPFAFARAVTERSLAQLQALTSRFGFPTAWSAIRYPLGSHDQIFNQWEFDNTNRVWVWDKPGPGDLRENRYFVELIGGAVTGRQNWYALAQARMGWALNIAIPGTPMMFMGTEVHHYGYWNPALDPFGDHRFEWAIAGDPTGMAMRNLVTDANNVRWNNPALRTDNGPSMPHMDPTNNVLGFLRWDDGGNVLMTVVNLSDNQWDQPEYGVNIGGTGDSWEEIFNSQAPQYGGWNDSGNYLADLVVQPDGRFYIRLPQWSVLIFRKR